MKLAAIIQRERVNLWLQEQLHCLRVEASVLRDALAQLVCVLRADSAERFDIFDVFGDDVDAQGLQLWQLSLVLGLLDRALLPRYWLLCTVCLGS